jgi:hypothetical protein
VASLGIGPGFFRLCARPVVGAARLLAEGDAVLLDEKGEVGWSALASAGGQFARPVAGV